jgi:sigma-E factor negative regulatory protein RseA
MKQQDENLSVLLDGDDAASLDVAIDDLSADVNLQYRMRRYQMIGAVMRNELPQAIDTGFHAEVMAQIKKETAASAVREDCPAATDVSAAGVSSWFKPFAGLAVAASVALVTVVLWGPQQQNDGVPDALVSADQQKIEQLASQTVAGGAVPVSTRVQADGMRWQMQNESAVLQQKLNAYLVNHTEYSNSMQGLIPQARVAGFDAQQ